MVVKKLKINNRVLFLLVGLLVVVLDQVSKYLVRLMLDVGDGVSVLPYVLDFTYVKNTGAAFSSFLGFGTALMWFSIVVVGGLLYYHEEFCKEKFLAVFGGLLLGGAIGNLIDRVFLGYVVDFINIHVWPIFNVADMAISVSVIGLLYYYWKEK